MTQYADRAGSGQSIKRKFYRRYCAGSGRLADIGCSIGLLLRHDVQHCIGVDRDWTALLRARRLGARVVVADFGIEGLPFADLTFDTLNLDNVIEHLPVEAGRRLFAECARILRPGGRLLIRTPDARRCAEKFRSDPEHVCPYDRSMLTNAVEAGGLTLVSLGHWAYNYLKWVPLLNRWHAVTDPVEAGLAMFLSDNWFAVARKTR